MIVKKMIGAQNVDREVLVNKVRRQELQTFLGVTDDQTESLASAEKRMISELNVDHEALARGVPNQESSLPVMILQMKIV